MATGHAHPGGAVTARASVGGPDPEPLEEGAWLARSCWEPACNGGPWAAALRQAAAEWGAVGCPCGRRGGRGAGLRDPMGGQGGVQEAQALVCGETLAVVCFNKCGQVGGVACVVREPDGPWIHLHPQTQESVAPQAVGTWSWGRKASLEEREPGRHPGGAPGTHAPPLLLCLFPLLGSIPNSWNLATPAVLGSSLLP